MEDKVFKIENNENLLLLRYCEKLDLEPSEIETPLGLSVEKLINLMEIKEKEHCEKKVEELKNNLELNKHKDIQLTPIKQLTVNRYTSLKADLLCEWCKQNYEVKEYQLETMNKSFLHSQVIDLCEKMIDLDFKSSHPYLKLLNIYIHYDKMDNYLRISKKYKDYKKNITKDNE